MDPICEQNLDPGSRSGILWIFDATVAATRPGTYLKDADRDSASDGGQETSIALI